MRKFIQAACLVLLALPGMAQVKMELKDGWEFRRTDEKSWRSATVPGTVHTDLLAHKLIADPYYGANEKGLQWIDKKDWEYRSTVQVTGDLLKYENVSLDFTGLDTYADVYLNNQLILQAGNMFAGKEVPVKQWLKEGVNQLRILFYSPIDYDMRKFLTDRLIYPAGNDASDIPLSVYARKAPYHYGWDWGPRFVTSGIYRPVFLKAWNQVQLRDVWIKQLKLTDAVAEMEAVLSVDADSSAMFVIIIHSDDNSFEEQQQMTFLKKGRTETGIPFIIKKPKRWWPNGLGEQHLYGVTVTVKAQLKPVQEVKQRFGLRTVEVINEPDKDGTSFLIKVNGKPVFMKGTNYIPSDNFLPRVTTEKYRKMFADMKQCNFNMVRVWGGGVYEDDRFYDFADENGILVWQDFMFACTLYPSDPDFIRSVKEETAYNITRLRKHASLALWCGNNEVSVAIKNWGWKEGYAYTDEQWAQLQKGYDTLFREVLKNEVARYDPGRFYFPSSPISNWGKPEDFKHGDNHYWGVWHGMEWFEAYKTHVPRFMSEYGFQSFPDIHTVRKFADSSMWDINSFVMQAHQKSATRGNAAIKTYMDHYYKSPRDFPAFLYLSQVLQAEGMKLGMEAHRRAMPYCMGTLYWQFNDSWPGASWSGIDYYGRWKALQYYTKRAYEPLLVSLTEEEGHVKTYVINDRWKDEPLELVLQLLDMEGKVLTEKKIKYTAKSNTSAVANTVSTAAMLSGNDPHKVILYAKLVKNNQTVSDNVYYFAAPRALQLPQAAVTTHVLEQDGKLTVQVSSTRLARNVCLMLEHDDTAHFSDNYFDLLPGTSRTLVLTTKLTPAEVNKQLRIMHLANACIE